VIGAQGADTGDQHARVHSVGSGALLQLPKEIEWALLDILDNA
jgi:hypothetical protein